MQEEIYSSRRENQFDHTTAMSRVQPQPVSRTEGQGKAPRRGTQAATEAWRGQCWNLSTETQRVPGASRGSGKKGEMVETLTNTMMKMRDAEITTPEAEEVKNPGAEGRGRK